jgi:hypothetical protein
MARPSDEIPRGLFESTTSYARRVQRACPNTPKGYWAKSYLASIERDRKKKAKSEQDKRKREKADKEKRDKERKARGAKKPVKSGWW